MHRMIIRLHSLTGNWLQNIQGPVHNNVPRVGDCYMYQGYTYQVTKVYWEYHEPMGSTVQVIVERW